MAARDWLQKDFYGLLGVPKDAPKAEIKRAYRRLAQKYHPDANKGDKEAEHRFKEISEAHAVLTNDQKRKEYDQVRAYAEGGGVPFGFTPGGGDRVRVNVGDIGDLFGDSGIGDLFEEAFGFRARPRKGQDAEAEVHLEFEDAVRGATVEVAGGSRVRIPAGVSDGARIRVAGMGGAAPPDGKPGDLYVRVRVAPHPVFRQGKNGNLVVHVPVTLAEAALGANVQVPTLDGAVTLKVPAGTRHGRKLRVKGRGSPAGSGRGDLIAVIDVEVPQRLSKKERELLEEFARVHGGDPRAHFSNLLRGPSREAS